MFKKFQNLITSIGETIAKENVKEILQSVKTKVGTYRKLGGRLDAGKIMDLALLKEQERALLPKVPKIVPLLNKEGLELPSREIFNGIQKFSSRFPLNIRGGENQVIGQYYIDFLINIIGIAIKNGATYLGTLSCFSPQLALLVVFVGFMIYLINQFSKRETNEGQEQNCNNKQEELTLKDQFVKVFGSSWELLLASSQYVLQNKQLFTFLVFLGIIGYNYEILGNSISNFGNKDQPESKELVITANLDVENSEPEPTSGNVESPPEIHLETETEVSIGIQEHKEFKIRTSNVESRELSVIQSSTQMVEDTGLVNQVEPREHFQMVENGNANPEKCWKNPLSRWKGIGLNKTIPFNPEQGSDFESQQQNFKNKSSSN